MTKNSKQKGGDAERVAAFYLEKVKHHHIVCRNFAAKTGEIDLISRDGDTWVFTEVKYRADLRHGTPGQAVTKVKQRHIVRTALLYLQQHALYDVPLRFDVVEVVGHPGEKPRVRHLENAFQVDRVY